MCRMDIEPIPEPIMKIIGWIIAIITAPFIPFFWLIGNAFRLIDILFYPLYKAAVKLREASEKFEKRAVELRQAQETRTCAVCGAGIDPAQIAAHPRAVACSRACSAGLPAVRRAQRKAREVGGRA